MMLTVKELKEVLEKYNEDSLVEVRGGEWSELVVWEDYANNFNYEVIMEYEGQILTNILFRIIINNVKRGKKMYCSKQYLAPEVRAKLVENTIDHEVDRALHEALYRKVLVIYTLNEGNLVYTEGSIKGFSLKKYSIESDHITIYFKSPNDAVSKKRTFLKSTLQGWEEYEVYVG